MYVQNLFTDAITNTPIIVAHQDKPKFSCILNFVFVQLVSSLLDIVYNKLICGSWLTCGSWGETERLPASSFLLLDTWPLAGYAFFSVPSTLTWLFWRDIPRLLLTTKTSPLSSRSGQRGSTRRCSSGRKAESPNTPWLSGWPPTAGPTTTGR